MDPSRVRLSCPGKTFLAGEYLALRGGPSVLLATGPRFELKATRVGRERVQTSHPFHPESPAGRRWKATPILAAYQVEFLDPYHGAGGFGASSAQFLLVDALAQLAEGPSTGALADSGWAKGDHGWKENVKSGMTDRCDFARRLVSRYRECAFLGKGEVPSGADVVTHLLGRVTIWDARDKEALSDCFSWTFRDVGFAIFRTGAKLSTHVHLSELTDLPENRLRPSSEGLVQAIRASDSSALIKGVMEYGRALENAGWVTRHTGELLSSLRENAGDLGVLASKGCGAMGADTILVLHKPESRARVHRWAKDNGLPIVATEQDLSRGLRVEVERA